MKQSLVRSNDRRDRECENGSPPCHYAPADGDNPLGLCIEHLEKYRAHIGLPAPMMCPACNPISVFDHGKWIVIVGVMCFACDRTNGGTVPSAKHRAEARASMRARLGALFVAGDRGAEWAALLARCPADIREAIERRLARVAP